MCIYIHVVKIDTFSPLGLKEKKANKKTINSNKKRGWTFPISPSPGLCCIRTSRKEQPSASVTSLQHRDQNACIQLTPAPSPITKYCEFHLLQTKSSQPGDKKREPYNASNLTLPFLIPTSAQFPPKRAVATVTPSRKCSALSQLLLFTHNVVNKPITHAILIATHKACTNHPALRCFARAKKGHVLAQSATVEGRQ